MLRSRPEHISHAALPAADLYKKVERSVFVVGAARSIGDARARDILQGSAVAIAEHLLLTNCHVVQNRPVIVLLQDHVTWRAKLVASDPENDRCVLESEGAALVPIAGVREFSDIAVGERVFAIGAPRALERTLTEGLVSGLRAAKGRNLIQTSAPLSPGSSGGGLFDERGNLLGITTLGLAARLAKPQFRDLRRRFLGIGRGLSGSDAFPYRGGRAAGACPYAGRFPPPPKGRHDRVAHRHLARHHHPLRAQGRQAS